MVKSKSLNNRKSVYYKALRLIIKMDKKNNPKESIMLLKKKILEALEDEREKLESKKIFFDEKANQFSIKIPKSFILKARADKNSVFSMVFSPEKGTLNRIKESKLIIFLEKHNDQKGERSD